VVILFYISNLASPDQGGGYYQIPFQPIAQSLHRDISRVLNYWIWKKTYSICNVRLLIKDALAIFLHSTKNKKLVLVK
jgi:hypothetical protein